RDAIDFGLAADKPGYNIFVIGPDRSGRMTASLERRRQPARKDKPNDWLYLNNFRHPSRPRPFRVPAGVGRRFRDAMSALVPRLRESVVDLLNSEEYQAPVKARREALQQDVGQQLDAIRKEAEGRGLALVQSQSGTLGFIPKGADPEQQQMPELSDEERDRLLTAQREMLEKLASVNLVRVKRQAEFGRWLKDYEREAADQAMAPQFEEIAAHFNEVAGLGAWLVAMRQDVLDNLALLRPDVEPKTLDVAMRRYAVNVLVDNSEAEGTPVILEGNPTYENLFGLIEYNQIQGTLATDFTMIRGGALHRANGGVLVLRAEAIARDAWVWMALKAALRDGCIELEERHRAAGIPIANAPRPKPIPLKVKVVIVGAPAWYYTFFSVDPEFRSHFKIKADIDTEMPATPEAVGTYRSLIAGVARRNLDIGIAGPAMQRILGMAARWADRRDRITARFELFEDVIHEAAIIARGNGQGGEIDEASVRQAIEGRQARNERIEDLSREAITEGTMMVDVAGAVIGQVNGLTVREMGDHAFGLPARITARTSAGHDGVLNIEREAAMSGPIQQKGALVIQGFLQGHFGRLNPPSFNATITFEQSYGGVEGDSASMAELVAILSDLAGVPIRQDLAITGSVNQRGQAQAVGGVSHKVEGFFHVCRDRGPLNGSQGVIVPASNARHLVLMDEVGEAIEAGRFHVHVMDTIEDALFLLTGMQAGTADPEGHYPEDTIYGLAQRQIGAFDRLLTRRVRVN
ncbi:MAG: ATP-binding protein, partial [Azospirillaceae bacterium]